MCIFSFKYLDLTCCCCCTCVLEGMGLRSCVLAYCKALAQDCPGCTPAEPLKSGARETIRTCSMGNRILCFHGPVCSLVPASWGLGAREQARRCREHRGPQPLPQISQLPRLSRSCWLLGCYPCCCLTSSPRLTGRVVVLGASILGHPSQAPAATRCRLQTEWPWLGP